MPETYTWYGLSDIKYIWVPCSNCNEYSKFLPNHGFHSPYKQHVKTKCQKCNRDDGFEGTFKAIRRIKRLSEEPLLDGAKNLLSQIKIEFKDDSTET